jgi:SAM-dependent methyltransferase
LAETIRTLHDSLVFGRRVRVLASHLSTLIPPQARVLDVGCGDGSIARIIAGHSPGVLIEGIDVLVRPATQIAVRLFDGVTIPYPDRSFDVVMFVDVLHHTADPTVLLREAARVGKVVLIKDHFRRGFLAGATLRFMDWVGNAHHSVALPYNYWSEAQWDKASASLGLKRTEMRSSLGIYPAPASWLFERGLHFIGKFTR